MLHNSRLAARALGLVLALALAPVAFAQAAADADDDWSRPTGSAAGRAGWGGVAEWRGLLLRPGGEDDAHAHQALLRLTFEREFAAGHQLVAHAQWEHARASTQQMLLRLQQATPPADRALRLFRQWQHAPNANTVGFDWLYLQGGWRHGRYAVGRQPIAPSIGRLWAPADLFAPFRPSDLERLYKPGVDAAQLVFFAAERIALTTVLSADRDTQGGVQAHWQQRAELEAPWGRSFVMVGSRRSQRIAAAGIQVNNLAGNDVYAELLWHHGPLALPGIDGRASGVRALLGASRKLVGDTVATLELFHQSRGTGDPAQYDAFVQRAAAIHLPHLGVGRLYTGMAVSARPHPLVGIDTLLLANLDDGSAALVGSLVHTPLPNLRVRVTLAAPVAGASASEYRRAGRAVQLVLQKFF